MAFEFLARTCRSVETTHLLKLDTRPKRGVGAATAAQATVAVVLVIDKRVADRDDWQE